MKRLFSLMAALGIILLTAVPAAADTEMLCAHVATVYNDRNGLPTGEANDIVQTPDGYIWIGSYAGLIRYDGTQFRNFSEEGRIPTSTVRSLFVDSRGRLWVGSNDMGVFMMNGDGFVQPEGQPAGSFLCIRSMTEDCTDGSIVISSSSGLARVTDGAMSRFSAYATGGKTIYSAAVDHTGRLWAAANSGVYIISHDGVLLDVLQNEDIFIDGQSVYSITGDRSGTVWAGSDANTVAKIVFEPQKPDLADRRTTYYTLSDVTTINSLSPTADGGVTVNGLYGFAKISGTVKELSAEENAVSVTGSCIDYEGNVWLASTSIGVVKITNGCFSTPNSTAGIENEKINCVVGSDNGFFLGTDNGVITCGKNWQRKYSALSSVTRGMRVRHLICDSLGRIWAACYSEAPVICYDPSDSSVRRFTVEDGITNESARVLLEMSDGSIAAGTQDGLCIIAQDGTVKSFPNLSAAAVLCLLETDSGSLLVGTDGDGVYELVDDFSSHYCAQELNGSVVLRITRDAKKDSYFISTGNGLFYSNGTRTRKLESLNKNAGNIFDMYLADGKLYLVQNSGVLEFNRSDVISENGALPNVMGFSQGLTGSIYANTWNWLSPDGQLYIATGSGVSIFGFTAPEHPLPKATISRVTVDGEEYAAPHTLTLAHDAGRVTIDFAALSFTDTTPVVMSYMLEGFDSARTTVKGEKSGSVSYTNLAGGSYTFKLKLSLADCPWKTAEYTVNIVKQKALTEQPWFIAAAVAAAVALTVGVTVLCMFIRISYLNRKQRFYRDMVDQSLRTFAGTIDAKDRYTEGHSQRVAIYSKELARRMGMNPAMQEHIYYVALLHDIGKIGIPDSVLNKPGRLTSEEYEIIKRHPLIGADILKNYTAIKDVTDGAKYHHERYDGKGYCEGLAGEAIPLIARIIAVADTYDAMSSKRCYRESLSSQVIIEELERVSGSQLDPSIVPHMISMIKEGAAPVTLTEEQYLNLMV